MKPVQHWGGGNLARSERFLRASTEVLAFLPGPSILLVDDHPDTLRFYETSLSLEGFSVSVAASGHDAVRLLSHGFDAIATDLAMPGMDGAQLIRQIRALTPPIPTIVVTGQVVDARTEVELIGIGACRVLPKPCDGTRLANLLRCLIDSCPHDCGNCANRQCVTRPWRSAS